MERDLNDLLVGDIGGTNIRLAVASALSGSGSATVRLGDIWRAPTSKYSSFSDAVAHFLTTHGPCPKRAIFALAGPAEKDTVALTNLNWTVRRSELEARFSFTHLRLMNDFAAMARSVPDLPPSAFRVLQEGAPSPDAKAIIVAGAGTGLGQALLLRLPRPASRLAAQGAWHVQPGEGGHQSFAPQDDREYSLLKYMYRHFDAVSAERVCSGMGLPYIYAALSALDGAPEISPQSLSGDVVTHRAAQGEARAIETCRIAARKLMGFIGDAVLSTGAWDGAVLAGGVSEHLYPYLMEPSALDRFTMKGAMHARLRRVPLSLLVDNQAPLLGAALFDQKDDL